MSKTSHTAAHEPKKTAADQGAFQSVTSQLYQQKQALASAIFTRQMAPVSYNAGVGKLIVISLSRQVLTAYQDGNAVLTTFVATGRPQLPTPPGVYRIFHRYSPYKMISPWPYGSPYWYPDSWTNWARKRAYSSGSAPMSKRLVSGSGSTPPRVSSSVA